MMTRLVLLAAFGLGISTSTVGAIEPIKTVASFSILADITKQIGGDRVSVDTLVGPEEDAHVYDPTPRDAVKIAVAKLVVINGLGFEGWIDRLIKLSAGAPKVTIASDGIVSHQTTIEGHERTDPHAWQDLRNVQIYARNIAESLIQIDPDHETLYRANLARYTEELATLDQDIRSAISAIPAERRKIVTTHDAFGYFAQAYGIEMIAPQGVSTEAEASAKDVARIIRQVKSEKIPAVFLENVSDHRLAERIATESGARMGGKLYSDALSKENAPAGTYIAMMKTNIRELTKALMP
jgi:zinc/manganese transport system substrate-binding protein